MEKRRKTVKWTILCATAFGLCILVLLKLFYDGVILFNNPSTKKYPVRGVDVSSYQGTIDWQILSEQDISFAFIKATEGSTHQDDYFSHHYEQAPKSGLAVGFYHFFSYDSQGITQAENFIKTVQPFDGMLPPVIDLEFYGNYEKEPPAKQQVTQQLRAMIEALQQHYGVKPIIYATKKSYDLYLADAYAEYDIWIRDVITKPSLSDGREWTFWQYTNRERLSGYEGTERFIDMNVFRGNREEFDQYVKNNSVRSKTE